MADSIAEELEQNIQLREKWPTPCLFNRNNRVPLDSKSCFKTYEALQAYIDGEQSTAYPGMYVAVTSKDDPKAGPYIIMSDGEHLHPVKIDGKITGVSLLGDDESRIDAEVDENGNANLDVTDISIGTVDLDELRVDGIKVQDLIPNLKGVLNLQEIDLSEEEPDNEIGFTLVQVATLLNQLIGKLKDSAQLVEDAKEQALLELIGETTDSEETEGN